MEVMPDHQQLLFKSRRVRYSVAATSTFFSNYSIGAYKIY